MAILGIDEVGRGPWAGPLVIGAVVLPERLDKDGQEIESQSWQNDLADSKKLTVKKREKLAPIIKEKAKATGLGWVSSKELDSIGLAEALKLATRRAVEKIPRDTFSEIIIDGTSNFLKGTDLENLVSVLPRADAKIKEVSGASIIAKVARDNYMIKLAEKYPGYGFEKHVGYGTALHKKALTELGPCPEHRHSFKPVYEAWQSFSKEDKRRHVPPLGTRRAKRRSRHSERYPCDDRGSAWRFRGGALYASSMSARGARARLAGYYAEGIVADYLKRQGHTIIARNYKTKFYEIDIVSATTDHIYFTEVKYRKTDSHGAPLDFIDAKKKQKIAFASNAFMQFLSKRLNRDLDDMPSPILAVASVSGPDFKLDKWLELVV
ncbi:ribonuclease HII [Candidatus Saccharibacteria bacterium]|nr:ribonuclease HII [Candidatus Saccharibacteria bacterium]